MSEEIRTILFRGCLRYGAVFCFPVCPDECANAYRILIYPHLCSQQICVHSKTDIPEMRNSGLFILFHGWKT